MRIPAKTLPILSTKQKREWEEVMGKNFISEAYLRKRSNDDSKYELKLGQIGDLRVVEAKTEPTDLFTDFDFNKKEKILDILQEFYVVSGEVEVTFKNSSYLLKKGSILVIDNNDLPESFRVTKRSHIIVVYMPTALVRSWIPRIYKNLKSKLISPPGASAKLLGSYLELISEFAINTNNSPIYQSKAIVPLIMSNLSMLVFALGDKEEEKPSKIKDIQLVAAKKYMLVNMSDSSLTPKKISEELGISVRYLHWIFKQTEDQETVLQYLIRKRIELAKLLLATSSSSLYSITEVAFMSGFNDSTHFSRRFKEEVGLTPSKFRDQNDI